MAQLRVNDFSGGETDRFRDGQVNFAQRMKNLYISENRRALSRPGYGGLYADARPFGNQPVQVIWNHCTTRETIADPGDNDLMAFETFIISNGNAVRVRNAGSTDWRTVLCADGNIGGFSAWSASEVPATKYVRINDNEFVVFFDGAGLDRYPLKFYRESSSVEWQYVSLGLPTFTGDSFASPQVGGGNNWLYAIVLKHTYTLFEEGSGLITKEVRSAPAVSSIQAGVSDVDIICPVFGPTLSADWVDNQSRELLSDGCFAYDDVVWEIYRTVSNGSVFYKIGEDDPGDTFSDTALDSDITDGAQLYTNGGAVFNEMSNGRVFDGTYANNALWLASTQRVWQAKVGIFDAVNGSFVFTAREGQTIRAVDSIDVYPIVLTSKGVYRIEGIVDDLGNGTHRVRTISETDGALSSRTTVKAGDRLYYLTSDGIYVTNGYTTSKVSNHYNDTYRALVKRIGLWNSSDMPVRRLSFGVWDKEGRRIHWFFPKAGESYASDVLTLDLKYRHDEGLCITSGEVPYTARDGACEDGNIQLVTNLGYVLAQDPDNTSDVDEDNGLDALGIEWDYVSCSLSFGSSLVRKFFSRLLLHFTNRSDLTVKVQSDTDESDDYRDHNPIRERGFTRGLYFLKRWFPKGRLRGTYKTIRITNEAQTLYRSDDYVLCDRNGTTITTADGSNWPGAEVGFTISFGAFITQYRIESISGDTIIVASSAGVGTDSAWQIKGIPTNEAFEMNGYTVDYYDQQEGHTQSATVVEGNG